MSNLSKTALHPGPPNLNIDSFIYRKFPYNVLARGLISTSCKMETSLANILGATNLNLYNTLMYIRMSNWRYKIIWNLPLTKKGVKWTDGFYFATLLSGVLVARWQRTPPVNWNTCWPPGNFDRQWTSSTTFKRTTISTIGTSSCQRSTGDTVRGERCTLRSRIGTGIPHRALGLRFDMGGGTSG